MIRKISKILFYVFNKNLFGKLGYKSLIEKPVLVVNKNNIFLGKSVNIRNNARIEPVTCWQGQKFNPKIEFGDNVSIEQGLHLTCAKSVFIGKNTIITPYVVITDIKHNYQEINKPILEQAISYSEVKIGENCFIGSGAKILPGTSLGNQCIIGTNSVVQGVFCDYCVIAGNPAKIIKKYNPETKEWIKVRE